MQPAAGHQHLPAPGRCGSAPSLDGCWPRVRARGTGVTRGVVRAQSRRDQSTNPVMVSCRDAAGAPPLPSPPSPTPLQGEVRTAQLG